MMINGDLWFHLISSVDAASVAVAADDDADVADAAGKADAPVTEFNV